jgi:4-hydroxy-3-polyprenylbenzoate decarboxylase
LYKDLRAFMRALEKDGELVRVAKQVDPILEITEIADRVSKSKDGGKALLFENVKGSPYPVLINAFGSFKRMAMAMESDTIEVAARRIQKLLSIKGVPKGIPAKLGLLGEVANLAKISPKMVKSAPCQEIVQDKPKLSDFPILQCWPKDAGRFITLPLVFTKDPETGERNCGMYRMQVYDDASTGMHWQTQKDGAIHSEKMRRRSQKLEVAVAIGCDPATVFSAVVPLPYGLDEMLFSGFVRNVRPSMWRCRPKRRSCLRARWTRPT